jgi:hypothetical protein
MELVVLLLQVLRALVVEQLLVAPLRRHLLLPGPWEAALGMAMIMTWSWGMMTRRWRKRKRQKKRERERERSNPTNRSFEGPD